MRIEAHPAGQLPEAAIALRRQVFTAEQQVPEELEWDDTDASAVHYLVHDDTGEPIATARLYEAQTGWGAIGRMAVAASARGQDVGTRLLTRMLQDGLATWSRFTLGAQETAVDFYRRLGFYVVSDRYMDAGIPHRRMNCTAPSLVTQQEAETRCPFLLASDTTSWQLGANGDQLEALLAMAEQATRRLWIHDSTLSHALYDDSELEQAVSQLARRSRHSDIRFLIHDDSPLVKRRHSLVELMRRLPSRMGLRLVNTSYPHPSRPVILVDDSGVISRHDFNAAEGFANASAPRRVRPFAEEFERAWEYGRSSVELRDLPL
ncbi:MULTISPECIES: GNAT family N-acetyltransferase [Halomonadaceae]|jgi:predicted GNAT family N-acyltransferase|uniref:GNAT family N-acetyltransferase n=1 Tax=Vreelandella halophila TaxID=86177 RepID=A0A9X5B500_9GAMM|nr:MULTISPECIES: GNAT family N-acetyltransferase [Halomonas]MYL26875.1 GNAT family N-acetyltransferase [Halomonas utahensis]MYL74136.1 GNAT family N-acetyltransferase [Halomonas sp. 22501_18_FS]